MTDEPEEHERWRVVALAGLTMFVVGLVVGVVASFVLHNPRYIATCAGLYLVGALYIFMGWHAYGIEEADDE